MKKLKKFIKDKGGLKVFIISITLILIASALMILGVVYADFGGDWNKIPEILSSDFAISVYVVIGLLILVIIYISFIFGRKREIK